MPRTNALFVCSRNQWRSPTAEHTYRDDPRLAVRSRGLSPSSARQLTAADLAWAEVVFVMETKHRERILVQFGEALGETSLFVLDIPDDYGYLDPELLELLRERVEERLEELQPGMQ